MPAQEWHLRRTCGAETGRQRGRQPEAWSSEERGAPVRCAAPAQCYCARGETEAVTAPAGALCCPPDRPGPLRGGPGQRTSLQRAVSSAGASRPARTDPPGRPMASSRDPVDLLKVYFARPKMHATEPRSVGRGVANGDADGATVAGLARERPQTRRQASAKLRGRSVACAGRRHHRCVGKASVAPAPSPRVSGLATARGAGRKRDRYSSGQGKHGRFKPMQEGANGKVIEVPADLPFRDRSCF
eukprot:COSAG06_NODE_2181_length_7402_cov_8.928933_9_plen_244_part_00